MQRTGFEYTRVLNNIKRSVNVCVCHFEKKVTKFKTKVFQRDFVNIFGESNFTSICFVNKDLMCATGNNEI